MNNRLWTKSVSFQDSGMMSIDTCISLLNAVTIVNMLGSDIPIVDSRGAFIFLKNAQHLPKVKVDDSLSINTARDFVLNNSTVTFNNAINEESNCGGLFCDRRRVIKIIR